MTHETDRVAVTVAIDDDRALVQAIGEFDMATASVLDEALRRLADDGVSHITLDLEQVPFMDSAGLHPIIDLVSHRAPITVSVVNACPGVAHLFQLHGVESLMIEVAA
jgi:anti-anti-sigma factor